METTQIYLMAALIVLIFMAATIFFLPTKFRTAKLSPLARISLVMVIAALFLYEYQVVGVILIVSAIALAIVDISNKRRKP